MEIVNVIGPSGVPAVEVIEIKGSGHPDTLSDALAEKLSQAYSNHTRDRFGAILHHNFDKVGLLGGRSRVALGSGVMVSPVRVLLNGRATPQMGDEQIDVEGLLTPVIRSFLTRRLPKLHSEKDIVIFNNLSTGSSPGHVETEVDNPANRKHWFAPRSLADVRERKEVSSNDTSVGTGYAPRSAAEHLVMELERHLTSPQRLVEKPWQGTDIKIMARRVPGALSLTMCLPQIADHVPTLDTYRANIEAVRGEVLTMASERFPDSRLSLSINTKDNFDIPELYLTATGSSVESGDEGLVGRGNRPNGLINMSRPFSMEGAAGKNPVYHVGKIYNIAAQRLADRLYERYGCAVHVWMVSQEGRLLADPWQVAIQSEEPIADIILKAAIDEVMAELPAITDCLVAGRIRVY